METIVDEDLTWEINVEESMWSLVPGEHIHVNLAVKFVVLLLLFLWISFSCSYEWTFKYDCH